MKYKNINPIERYFDKITVVIAAAAAGYFIYAGYVQEPNAVNGIKPPNVEAQITQAVNNLDKVRQNQAKIVVTPESYVEQYVANQKQPLPQSLLAAVPTIEPMQLSINLAAIGPTTQAKPVALPTVPVLTEPEVASLRGQIIIAVPPNWPANAPLPPPRDVHYVQGKALLQVSALVEKIDALPQLELRHTAIYRIEVQRQEQHGGGTWSDWTDVPRLPIDPLPIFDASKIEDKNLAEQIGNYRALVMSILNPPFYPLFVPKDVTPSGPPKPVVPNPNIRLPVHGAAPLPAQDPNGTDAANEATQEEIRRRMNLGQNPPLNGPGFQPGVPQGAVPGVPGVPVAPVLAAPDAPALFDLPATDETVPMGFYDDQVQPGYTYRYRARLVIINPLYHLPKQILTIPPEGRDQLLLASDWTEFKPVTVEADEYFYLTANNLGGQGDAVAYFKIYKWLQGGWVAADAQAEPGLTLGGTHPVRLKNGTSLPAVDFGSVYTVVDVYPASGAGATDVQVVLLNNSTGELVIHDMLSDEADPQRRKLEDAVTPQRQVSTSVVP